MAFRDLNDFVDLLRQRGQLREISEPVDVDLEISHIADRVIKRGGPALLFTNVRGYNMPVLINTFGTLERMAWALGAESLDHVAAEIADLLEPQIPAGLIGRLRLLPKLKLLEAMVPKVVSLGPCQQIVDKISPSLHNIPIIKCWPQDGGRYITLPLVFTKHPQRGTRNVGMYRLQVFDDQTLGMHWQRHKGGAQHFRFFRHALDRRMEVAIALGPHPALIYAATAPLPDDVDEMMLAGFLLKRPVELVRCQTVDLEVPAESQIVLEGYVDPGESRMEGPFGDHQGYYSLPAEYPVFHLTCVTQRRSPIYPTIIVGPPPMEDGPLGKATERLFLPIIRKILPEVVDINLPVEGIFHNLAIVSIDKKYPGHAKKVMHGIWGLGQMMFTKIVVVVDSDCNIQDLSEVIWRVGTHIDPRYDTVFTEGPADALDFAVRVPDYGTKMGIDATRKWPEEGFSRPWPDKCEMPEEVKRRIDAIWDRLGL